MRGKPCSCAFTGHRPGKLPWGENENDLRCVALKAKLRAAVESAIHEGMEHFICGMAEGCDLYFAETVLALKARYPHITLEAAIPCPTQADAWPEAERDRYRELVARCDMETMVSDTYSSTCMQRRDRYMVDHAMLLSGSTPTARSPGRISGRVIPSTLFQSCFPFWHLCSKVFLFYSYSVGIDTSKISIPRRKAYSTV